MVAAAVGAGPWAAAARDACLGAAAGRRAQTATAPCDGRAGLRQQISELLLSADTQQMAQMASAAAGHSCTHQCSSSSHQQDGIAPLCAHRGR